MTTKLPAIPRGNDLNKIVAAVTETIEVWRGLRGEKLDSVPTWRQLISAGIASQKTITGKPQFSFPTNSDFITPTGPGSLSNSIPPTPTGLIASAGLDQILIQWDQVPSSYTNPAYTEIWRNGTDDLGTATRVTTRPYPLIIWSDPIGATNTTRYYWIRFVSQANALNSTVGVGPFNAVAGVSATTGTVGSSDLAPLVITADKLASGVNAILDVAGLPALPDSNYPVGVLVRDTTNNNKIYINRADVWKADIIYAGNLAANTIIAGDGAIANLAITNALIGNLAVDDAKVSDLSVAKLTAGTITAAGIYLGDNHFVLDGSTKTLTVNDGTYNRLKLGAITGGYGIEIRDASNNIILSSGGTYGAAIANSAVSLSSAGALSGAGGGAISLGSVPGTVGSTQIGTGIGVNQIPNADFRFGSDRHTYWLADGVSTFGWNVPDANWYLPGEGTLSLYQPDGNAYGGISGDIQFGTSGLSITQFYKVIPGATYEASAYTGAHRCAVDVAIAFYDSAGTYISEVHSTTNDEAKAGGTTLSGYQRLSVITVAPANAVTAIPFARKYTTNQGMSYADSYMFVSRAYFGEAYANQTEPSPWSGVTTGQFATLDQVTSSNVSTYIASAAIGSAYISDLAANKITAGTITASIEMTSATITGGLIRTASGTGQRVVINESSSNEMRFYNSSNVIMARIGDGNYSGHNEIAYFGTSSAGNTKTGAFGDSNSGYGLYGRSVTGTAVHGEATTGYGVTGTTNSTNPAMYGSNASTGPGVQALSNGPSFYALTGTGASQVNMRFQPRTVVGLPSSPTVGDMVYMDRGSGLYSTNNGLWAYISDTNGSPGWVRFASLP